MPRRMVIYNNVYIYYSAWGVCVARIRQSGQCESLYTVERATSIGSTFFFMCVQKEPKTITSALGLGGILFCKIDMRFFKAKKYFRESRDRAERRSKQKECFTELKQNNFEAHAGIITTSNQPASIAIIYKSELDYISRCILDCPNIETGGQLFGFWTVEGVPVVLYAIGPGHHANHQSAFFNQDVDYLTRVGRPIVEHFGLQHIGEWHSHHQLGLGQPSTHDAHTMQSTIEEKHLGRFLLCIGNCTNTSSTLNAFNFTEFCPNYVKAQWCIKDIDSPFREKIDNELAPFLVHPRTIQANMENVYSTESQQNLPPEYKESYWFSIKENRQILKQIMDSMGECSIQQDKDGYIYLTNVYGNIVDTVFFPEGFPQQAPRIKRKYSNNSISELNAPWSYSGDIYNDFINFYNQTIGL